MIQFHRGQREKGFLFRKITESLSKTFVKGTVDGIIVFVPSFQLKDELIAEKVKAGKKGTLTKTEEKKIESKKINVTDHDAKYMPPCP